MGEMLAKKLHPSGPKGLFQAKALKNDILSPVPGPEHFLRHVVCAL
jgi:hypothetical protein